MSPPWSQPFLEIKQPLAQWVAQKKRAFAGELFSVRRFGRMDLMPQIGSLYWVPRRNRTVLMVWNMISRSRPIEAFLM